MESVVSKITDPKREKYLKYEEEIYSRAFDKSDFATSDLVINDQEFLHYTVIRKIPETENNVLVILHGYGGFGGVFYKLVKELVNDYFIILVDLPDMGFSSRQKKPLFHDTPSALDYFVSRLQTFIVKIQLNRFSLIGHSIGAYVAAHLYKKVSSQVLKLFLLSPAGFNKVGDLDFMKKKKEVMENLPFLKKYIFKKVEEKIYEEKKSPFEMFWVPHSIKKWVFKKFWNSPRFRLSEEEAKPFWKIQSYFLTLPQEGEKCLGYFLHYGVNSTHPIIDVLLELKRDDQDDEKVVVFFGDHDFMDGQATMNNLNQQSLKVPVYFVTNSDHQIIFQNPLEVATTIRFHDELNFSKILEKSE